MDQDDLHQPHDKLFKATFSDPLAAGAFLRGHLAEADSLGVDWKTLQFHPGSFIDERLRGYEADLLFSANVHGEGTFFYILWEHQRSESALMPLRLLSYFVRVWNKQVEGQSGRPRLWPILPVVLAQDKKRWKTSEHFRDLFGLSAERWEAVRGFTPDFAFRLLQLVDIPYEEIRGTPEGVLALRALRAEALGELLHEAVWESALLGGVSVAAAERFFRYMLNAGIDREAFERKVQKVNDSELTQRAMTFANQYQQLGMELGIEKGRQEALGLEMRTLRGVLEDALEIRFGAVPEDLKDALGRITDRDKMISLNRVALRCVSLEAFLESV